MMNYFAALFSTFVEETLTESETIKVSSYTFDVSQISSTLKEISSIPLFTHQPINNIFQPKNSS